MWIVIALYWLEQTLPPSLLMTEFLGLWVSAVIYLGLALRSQESSFRKDCFRSCRACCVGGTLFISHVAINDAFKMRSYQIQAGGLTEISRGLSASDTPGIPTK